MPSEKRITRVQFTYSFHPANPHSTPPSSSLATNQPLNSPSATRTPNPTPLTIPTSPALSSIISAPLIPSPQISTFDNILNKNFCIFLIAALTSKHAVLKEVRDFILTNNESRLKALNPYIHSYWIDLHVRSGCVCIDKKVAIANVLGEALIDDIHASHPGAVGRTLTTN